MFGLIDFGEQQMAGEQTYTIAQAHEHFAKKLHGQVWHLLDKTDRTKEDDERMVYAAHASCCHWLEAGSGVHHQRGEWLIARVYAVLNQPTNALHHAARCMELTDQHADEMKDFDRAFACEALARTHAIAGDKAEAARYVQRAEDAGKAITDPEDSKVFLDEFNAQPWNGLR
jgi:hypothetical protein